MVTYGHAKVSHPHKKKRESIDKASDEVNEEKKCGERPAA